MAFAATTVWEVRTTGSSANGGGFDTASGGTDYSQQDTAQYATTDAVANATTTITSATAGFTSAMVGNVMALSGGTNSLTLTRVVITTFTNSTTVTVDTTVPTGTGITMKVGGALSALQDTLSGANGVLVGGTGGVASATLTIASTTTGTIRLGSIVTGTGVSGTCIVTAIGTYNGTSGTVTLNGNQTITNGTTLTVTGCVPLAGNIVYIKNGTYTVTSTINGIWIGLSTALIKFIGYNSTRTIINNNATRPLITTSTNSTVLLTFNATGYVAFRNINWSTTATTRAGGWTTVNNAALVQSVVNCSFDGFTTGITGTGSQSIQAAFFWCEFKNCTAAGHAVAINTSTNYFFYGCTFKGNLTGASTNAGNTCSVFDSCLFDQNTNYGFQMNNAGFLRFNRCSFYKNGLAGVNTSAANAGINNYFTWILDSIFYGGNYGIQNSSSACPDLNRAFVGFNAFGGQATSARLNFNSGESEVTLSGNPFNATANNSVFTASAVGGTTMTVSAVTSGTLEIGSLLSGTSLLSGSIPAGTYITQFISGTGGTGTYLLSASCTFASNSGGITGLIDTHDLSLNNTAGAGASCRAAGFPTQYPSTDSSFAQLATVSTNYLDIGAVQHQDSGGGATSRAFGYVL